MIAEPAHRAPGSSRRFWILLGAATVGGWAVRLASVLTWQRYQDVQGDQVFYHYQAKALARGAGFVNPWAWNAIGEEIGTALHPPLYSLYLASWSVLGAGSPTAHKLASTLLGAGTVLLVGLLARRLAGDRAGVVAALLAAAYPNLWVNDGSLAAESLYGLVVAATLLAAYRLVSEPGLARSAAVGVMIGLAALTRAEGVALVALLALPLILRLGELRIRQRLLMLAACCCAAVAVMAPWVIRNLATFEDPVLLSSGAGFVLEIANCDETYSGPHLGYWDSACDRPETWLYQDRNQAARHEPAVESAKREAGVQYMKDHAGRLPVVVLARVGRMWDLYRPLQNVDLNAFFERRGAWPSRAGLVMYVLLVPMAAGGSYALWRRGVTLVPFLALAASVTLTAAISFGITRYRIGVDVALPALAGVGLDALIRRGSASQPRPYEASG